MLPDETFRSPEWIDKIEILVHKAEEIEDSTARAVAIDLSRAVMQFHEAALSRTLEMISDSESGEEILSRIAEDPLTSSMLLAHDLHPETTGARLARAIAHLDEAFRALGARVSLGGFSGNVVYVNFESARAWPGPQTRTSVEKFIFQAVPEIEAVVIEGLKEEAPQDFFPVSGLMAASRP